MLHRLLIFFILLFQLNTVFAFKDSLKTIYSLLLDEYEKGEYEKSYDLCIKLLSNQELKEDNNKYYQTYYRLVYSALYIGNKYRATGDFNHADFYYKKALYHLEENSVMDAFSKAYLYDIIGDSYFRQKKYELSIEHIEKALTLYPDDMIRYRGYSYSNLAISNYRLGHIDKAEQYFVNAIKILETNPTIYEYELATTYAKYGVMYFQEGKNKNAEKLFLKAHELFSNKFEKEIVQHCNINTNLGHFYKNTGRYKTSISFFQQIIIGLSESFNDTSTYNNPTIKQLVIDEKLLYALRYKAHAFHQYYKFNTNDIKDLKASFETFELTFALIDKSRKESFSEKSRMYFTESYKETLNNAMLTAYELYRVTSDSLYLNKIFEYSEKGKSSLLYSSITELETKRSFGIPDTLLNIEKSLKTYIALLKTKIEKGNNKANKQLVETIKKHEVLAEFLKKQYPDYYRLKYEVDEMLITEIQEYISSDEVVVEYALTDTLLFIFSIEKDTSSLIVNRIDSNFFSNIQQLRTIISKQHANLTLEQINKFVNVSHYLYQYLIQPVALDIQGKRLVIIPDKELLNIPFEILIKDKSDNSNSYKKLHYLLFDNPIRYVYSATLQFKQHGAKENNGKIISFAPDYSVLKNTPYKECDYLKYKDNLKELGFAEKEARFVTELFNGDFYNKDKATEENFKLQSNNYGIIHLAMHSMVDNEEPMSSKLFFTYSDDTIEDHCLNTYELYNLHLNADLVVLSGCNTGYGKLLGGEGLMSIARGFIYSGSNSLALTLWSVNDVASYKIIARFYKYLDEGYSKDKAMQLAKIDYLKTATQFTATPFYWSGYIMVGDGIPLNNISKGDSKWIIYVISLLVLVLIYIFVKKKRKNIPSKLLLFLLVIS